MRTTILAFILLLFFNAGVNAQFGMIDSSFGQNGRVSTVGLYFPLTGNCVKVLKNNKLLVGGQFGGDDYGGNGGDLGIARFNADGTLDEKFGNLDLKKGIATIDAGGVYDNIYDLAVQKDGKILACGQASVDNQVMYFDFVATRFNSDGTLDTGFAEYGRTSENTGSPKGIATSIILLDDNKILVGGIGLDWIFDDQGTHQGNVFNSFRVVKYNQDGSYDKSFANNGIFTLQLGDSLRTDYRYFENPKCKVIVQKDGKILIGGTVQSPDYKKSDILIARIDSTGKVDSSFGKSGIIITDIDSSLDVFASMLLQENEKIVISANLWHGKSYDIHNDSIAILRFNTDGTLDDNFGKQGKTLLSYGNKPGSNVSSSSILSNGKILIAGYSYNDSTFLLATLNRNGSIDSSFGTNGFTATSFPTDANGTPYAGQPFAQDVDIAADGKIILAGNFNLMSSFSSTAIAMSRYFGETVLPITLSSFTATKKQNSVLINWQTTNESNYSFFSLERSNNNNDSFKEIARVNSKGNSSQIQQYSYEDIAPLNGNNYYRLRQFDKNGNATTSKIVLVNFNNIKIRIYPNPASAILNIEDLEQGTKTNITVLNSNGVIVSNASTDNSHYSLNVRSLPAGTYFLKINANDVEVVKQFIKR